MNEKKLKIVGVHKDESCTKTLTIYFNNDIDPKWLRMVFDAALIRAQQPVKIKKINRPVKRVNTW